MNRELNEELKGLHEVGFNYVARDNRNNRIYAYEQLPTLLVDKSKWITNYRCSCIYNNILKKEFDRIGNDVCIQIERK